MSQTLSAELQAKVDHTVALLRRIAQDHAPAVFANSFGAEDMVLADLITRHDIGIEQFSLDTGRLPAETYALMQQAAETYPTKPIKLFFPKYLKPVLCFYATTRIAPKNSFEDGL